MTMDNDGHHKHVKRSKILADPIHSYIELQPLCVSFMDSRPFQRLRHLKQLGAACYIYPSANHNRFEHSLGVSHLAAKWVKKLLRKSNPHVDPVETADVHLAAVAGLCHDLGHGPYSHFFEHEFLPKVTGRHDWSHEEMSGRIVEYIIDEKSIDLTEYGLLDSDLRTIQDLVTGQPSTSYGGKKFLYQIVANKTNGVDVDKFDYLARDSYKCGVHVACDHRRLMKFSRIIGDDICFKYKEFKQVHQLFYDRARMHQDVYTHPKVKCVDYMLMDVMVLANSELKMSDRIHDVQQYLRLNDNLVDHIDQLDPTQCEHEGSIRQAQEIIDRLLNRNLYCFVNEVVVPFADKIRPPSPEDIACCMSGDGLVSLKPEDIIVHENRIDFSMSAVDPRNRVRFYREDADGSFTMNRQHVSTLLNEDIQERRIRVYTRTRDQRVVRQVEQAFTHWVHRHLPRGFNFSTPVKPSVRPGSEEPEGQRRRLF